MVKPSVFDYLVWHAQQWPIICPYDELRLIKQGETCKLKLVMLTCVYDMQHLAQLVAHAARNTKFIG